MIVILKYNSGNVMSVQVALKRLGHASVISDDPEVIAGAGKVIIPGVGEAASAMNYLSARKLDKLIVSLKQPVLGICLGLQLMCSYSEEGNIRCLGIFDTTVRRFPPGARVPHMGWNDSHNSIKFLSICAPVPADFSGWNWEAKKLSFRIAAEKGRP